MNLRIRVAALLVTAALACVAATAGATGPTPRPSTTARHDLQWSQTGWRWPVRSPWEIRREFVAAPSQYAAGHRGVDLRVGPGDDIVSPADGTVFFTGTVVDRPVISIRHADGLMSSFEPVESDLIAGQTIARGDRIGRVSFGGHCADSCVHFGVRLHGQYVSPRLPLGSLPRAVLLPPAHG